MKFEANMALMAAGSYWDVRRGAINSINGIDTDKEIGARFRLNKPAAVPAGARRQQTEGAADHHYDALERLTASNAPSRQLSYSL